MAGFKFLPVNPHLLSTSLKPDMMKNCFTYKGILKRGGGTSKFCNLEGEIFFFFSRKLITKMEDCTRLLSTFLAKVFSALSALLFPPLSGRSAGADKCVFPGAHQPYLPTPLLLRAHNASPVTTALRFVLPRHMLSMSLKVLAAELCLTSVSTFQYPSLNIWTLSSVCQV